MRTVVVTGCTGFIGSHLVQILLEKNVEIYGIVRNTSTNLYRLPLNNLMHIIQCDFSDLKSLKEQISKKVDVFYHLAWEGASGTLRSDEVTQMNNVVACCEAANIAKLLGCDKFIAVGTIYEELCSSLLEKQYFQEPAFYLLSKQYAYQMTLKLCQKIGLSFVWCTFFHPIGSFMKVEQMMAYAILELLKGNSPIFGSAEEPYDILDVDDLASGLVLAGEKQLKESRYYIGSGYPRRLLEYLDITQNLLAPEIALGIGLRPDDGLRFQFNWMDMKSFQMETGFEPKYSFEEAVIKTANWFRNKE